GDKIGSPYQRNRKIVLDPASTPVQGGDATNGGFMRLTPTSATLALCAALAMPPAPGAEEPAKPAPQNPADTFAPTMARMKAAKAEIQKRQADLLQSRYDLANRAATGVTMSRGKAVQAGVRVKLAKGATWDSLASMTPDEIRSKDLFPAGFLPLP